MLGILKSYTFIIWDKIAKIGSTIYRVLILKVVCIWLRRINSIDINKLDLCIVKGEFGIAGFLVSYF
jgi:hypothetical protein